MFQSLAQALRLFRRERGFAAAVVFSLALGIGANTAIFTVVDGVLLRPLPYHRPGRLYAIHEDVPKLSGGFGALEVNLSHFMEWRRQASTFERMALYWPRRINLTGAGEPVLLPGASVSSGMLEMLGANPQRGRSFTREEELAGHNVALISDGLWKRSFAADPAIVGRTVTLDGRPWTVIGVLQPAFRFPGASASAAPEILVPLGYAAEDLQATFGEFNWAAIGRLRDGVAPEQALGQLNAIQAGIMRGVPEVKLELRATLTSLTDELVGDSRRGLAVLMAAVGAALLVLCVNLANLWLARAAGQARDYAIRTALGATRAQLARQPLIESLVLALTGGALGVLLAWWGVAALLRTAPVDLPRLAEIHMDARVLAFALLLSVASGLLFGALPALRSTMHHPQDALKAGSRSSTEGRRGVRLRQVLVALEVGLSAALLITAGLLLNSFVRLMRVNRGFEVERVLAVSLSLPNTRYAESNQLTAFFDRMLAKASGLPGVSGAAVVSAMPLQGETWVDVAGTEKDTRPIFERPSVNVRFISPEYFKVMGVPMRAGRIFEQTDRGRQVAIVSQATAARLWPGQDPTGRTMLHVDRPVEVVGVVSDFRSTRLEKEPVRMVYIPYWQRPRTQAVLILRTAMDPRGIAGAMRAAVWALDGDVPVPKVQTMVEVLNDSVAQRRFQMLLIAAFAAAALALAGLGTYGVLAYSMARRRQEIGIRMALGAAPADVRRMVLAQGMLPAVAGLLAGVAAALAGGHALASLLFQVSARDPFTVGAVALVLVAVSAAACLVPASRATRVDPAVALRAE